MKKYHAILVTGAGGDIGTGIGRILKEGNLAHKVIGADISPDHAGVHVFDVCEIVPRADDPRYFEELERLISEHAIDLMIPMSEAEIRRWHRTGATKMIGILVIMPNAEALRVGIDKLATAEFLKSHDLPGPWTKLVEEGIPHEFPCIIKNRGIGGKGGVEMVDESSVSYFRTKRPDHIWQEYLKGEEYTAGVYGGQDGEVRTIVMKRKLSGGTSGFTVSGEVVDEPEITRMLTQLAEALELKGSINVQLRVTKKGPVIFEINPRFSSTVVFRHKLGFQDVLWSLEEKAGEPASPYLPPKPGTKFYKGYTEYIT